MFHNRNTKKSVCFALVTFRWLPENENTRFAIEADSAKGLKRQYNYFVSG